MNKNSFIGWTLIVLIFMGFTFYQSREAKKQMAIQAQIDSVARAEARAQFVEDSIRTAALEALVEAGDSAAIAAVTPVGTVYKDSLLSSAAKGEAQYVTLKNDKVEIVLTSKGAQPYSVKVNDYLTWDGNELYLIKPENSKYKVSVYAGESISTDDFTFTAEKKLIAIANEQNDIEYNFSGNTLVITTFGLSAHGSRPEDGDNAAYKLITIIKTLYDAAAERNDFIDFGINRLVGDTKGEKMGVSCSDEQSGFLTYNVGMVGYDASTSEGFYSFDIRVPVTVDVNEIIGKLKEESSNFSKSIDNSFLNSSLISFI